MVRPNSFSTPSILQKPNPNPSHLQIHSLLDVDLLPPVEFHRWTLCLFQFFVSPCKECQGDRPCVSSRTLPLPLAFSLAVSVILPIVFTLTSARRRMAETPPDQRTPIPLNLFPPHPPHLSRLQSPQGRPRCCHSRVCARRCLSGRWVLHVDVRLLSCLVGFLTRRGRYRWIPFVWAVIQSLIALLE